MSRVVTVTVLVLLASQSRFAAAADGRERISYEVSLSRGIVEMNAGRYKEAVEAFGKALNAAPGDNPARYYTALCYNRAGKVKKAIALLHRILADDPDYTPARIELGTALLDCGEYAGAAEEFKEASRRQPGNAYVVFSLGQARGGMGEYERAFALLAMARQMDGRYAAPSCYSEAMFYEKMGKPVEAGVALKKVIDLEEPGTELRREAEESLELIARGGRRKRLNVRASARYEYDDNVMVAPDDSAIVAITDEGDFCFATTFELEILPIVTEKMELSTLYGFYQSVHNHLGDFNLQAHELDNIATFSLGPVQPFVGYIYRYYFLDDNKQSFIRDNELVAGLDIPAGRHSLSRLGYSYLAEKYFLDYYEPGDNRTAHNNEFGLDQYLFLLEGECWVRFGVHYDRNDARGFNYTYNGYRFNWELFLPLVWGWMLDTNFEYYIRDYPRNVDDRRDHRQEYDIRVGRRLNDYIEVGFEYTRIKNNSRVALFKYDRDIYSLVADFNF